MNEGNLETESEAGTSVEKSRRASVLENEFARGNYRLVRKGAKELLGSGSSEEKRVARELLAKTSPDPWFLALIGLSFLFFAAITFYAYSVGG